MSIRSRQHPVVLIALLTLLFSSGLSLGADPRAPSLEDEPRIDGFPASMQPWRDPEDRNVQRLDPGRDYYDQRRDMTGDNPKREPGPIDLQRYKVATTKTGFPTMFGLPIAMTSEDLKVGEVDVAIVGLPSTFNPSEGTGWAVNQFRFIRNYGFAGVGHDFWFNNHYFDIITVVDYGIVGTCRRARLGVHPRLTRSRSTRHWSIPRRRKNGCPCRISIRTIRM